MHWKRVDYQQCHITTVLLTARPKIVSDILIKAKKYKIMKRFIINK